MAHATNLSGRHGDAMRSYEVSPPVQPTLFLQIRSIKILHRVTIQYTHIQATTREWNPCMPPAFGLSSRLPSAPLVVAARCSFQANPPNPLSVFTQTSMLGGKERERRGCQLSRLISHTSHEMGSCFGNLKCPPPGGQKASETIKNQDQIARSQV